MDKKTLHFQNPRFLNQLYCGSEENLAIMEQTLNVQVVTREDWLTLEGPEEAVGRAESLFSLLQEGRNQGLSIKNADFLQMLNGVANGHAEEFRTLFEPAVVIKTGRRTIIPKTLGQKMYLQSIKACEIVFGIGPAGTGKTYLAVAAAVDSLRKNSVQKIILTRPAVEAGEALGFLPGDLTEKIEPYLRPLYDALDDMLDKDDASRLMEKGLIEIAPLAYMRGRTLSNAFVILDEAQNTTPEQMMMFLTRLGDRSKMVITGDVTQIDLPRSKSSGLLQVKRILTDIKGINFFHFRDTDVVRHPLVQRIINAYNTFHASPEGTQAHR
jgi:phosphate starvation-inducible PhoH-like protein